AVLCRHRDQREPTNHHAFHDIVHLTERRSWSLALQNLKKVDAIRFRPPRVTTGNRLRYVFTDWSVPGAISVLPGKAVLLTRCTNNALRVLSNSPLTVFLHRILILCFNE